MGPGLGTELCTFPKRAEGPKKRCNFLQQGLGRYFVAFWLEIRTSVVLEMSYFGNLWESVTLNSWPDGTESGHSWYFDTMQLYFCTNKQNIMMIEKWQNSQLSQVIIFLEGERSYWRPSPNSRGDAFPLFLIYWLPCMPMCYLIYTQCSPRRMQLSS